MKCEDCVFLSNIRLGAAVKCLVSGKYTVPDAESCEDYEKPKEVEGMECEVKHG